MDKPQIGVVGMAVMGKNLALNIESRGIPLLSSIALAAKQRRLLKSIRIKSWYQVTKLKILSHHLRNHAELS